MMNANRRDFIKVCAGGAAVVASAGWDSAAAAETSDMATERPLVRFGIVTDSHSGTLPSTKFPPEARTFRESLAKMRECVSVMNERKVDFLVELGDFVQNHPAHDQNVAALDAIERVFCGFDGPRYHVLGNHDLEALSRAEFNARIRNTGIAGDLTYYSFEKGSVTFIVLDHGYHEDGRPMTPGDVRWEAGHLSPKEREWLNRTIAATKGPVVLFSHWRIDPEGRDGLQALDSAGTRAILRQYPGKVLASFNGHDHFGSLVVSDDVFYYGLRSMITGSGAEMSGYAVVTVYDSRRVRVEGFRRAQQADIRLTPRYPRG